MHAKRKAKAAHGKAKPAKKPKKAEAVVEESESEESEKEESEKEESEKEESSSGASSDSSGLSGVSDLE
jgi:hypothetical protein